MSESGGTYKPGDVVNGHVLTSDGQWVPVAGGAATPPSPPGRPLAVRVAMAVLLIVVVGMFAIGSLLDFVVGAALGNGRLVGLGPLVGVGVGAVLFALWLRTPVKGGT